MQFRNFSESEQLRSSRLGEAMILSYDEENGNQDENAIDTTEWLERYSKSLKILVVRGHYKDKAHYQSAAQSLLLRSDICHQNITPLLCFKELPNSMHLLAAYQRGSITLEDRRVDSFKEVLKMTYHVLQALSYLQGASRLHGDIRPSNVSYYESEGLYKLNEMFVMNQKPIELNLKYAKDRKMDLYMAPHVFNDILNRKLSDVKYNYYKNETFSLGMIIFSIVSRKEVQKVYNRSLKAFDMRLFRSLKEEIKKINTDSQLEQKFLRFVITYMLNPDERQRLAPKRALNLLSKLIKKFMGGVECENEAEELIEGADEGGLGEYLLRKEEGGRAVQASKEEGVDGEEGKEQIESHGEEEGAVNQNAAEAQVLEVVQDSGQTTSAAGIGGNETVLVEEVQIETVETGEEAGVQKRNLHEELHQLAQSMEKEQIQRQLRKKKRKRKKKMLKKMAFFNLNKIQKKIKRRRRASGMFITMLKFSKETAVNKSTASKEREIMKRSSINPFRARSQTVMPGILEENTDRIETYSQDNRRNPFFRNRGNSLNPFMIQNSLSRKSSGLEAEEDFNVNPFKRGLSNLTVKSTQKAVTSSGFGANPFVLGGRPNPNRHIIDESPERGEALVGANPFMAQQVIQEEVVIKEEPQTPLSDEGSEPTPSESSLMDNMSLKIEVKNKKEEQKQNFMFLNPEEKHKILRILKPYLTTELRDPSSRMIININSRRGSAEITIAEGQATENKKEEITNQKAEFVVTEEITEEDREQSKTEQEEDEAGENIQDEDDAKESNEVMNMAKMILTEIGRNNTIEKSTHQKEILQQSEAAQRETQNQNEETVEHDFEIAEMSPFNQKAKVTAQVESGMTQRQEANFENIDYERLVSNNQSKERSRSKTKFPTQMMISEQGRFQYALESRKQSEAQEQKQEQLEKRFENYEVQTPTNIYYKDTSAQGGRNFQLRSVITSIKTFKRPSAPRMPIGISQRESIKPKYVSYNQFSQQISNNEPSIVQRPEIRESLYPNPKSEIKRETPSFKKESQEAHKELPSLYQRGNFITPEQSHPQSINFQNHFLNTEERDFQMKINKTQYPLQQLESSMIKQSVINLASQSAIPFPQDQSIVDDQRQISGYYESGGTYNQTPSDWIQRGKKEVSSGGTHGVISLNMTNNTNQLGDIIHESTVQLPSSNDLRIAEVEGGFKKKVNLDSRDFGMRIKSEDVGDTLKAISQFGIAKIRSEGVHGAKDHNEGGLERIISITNQQFNSSNNGVQVTQAGSPGKINQWAQKPASDLQQRLCSPKNNNNNINFNHNNNSNNNINTQNNLESSININRKFDSKTQVSYHKVISPVQVKTEGRTVLATQKKTYPEQNGHSIPRQAYTKLSSDGKITSSRTTYHKPEPRVERIRVTTEGSKVIANRSPKNFQYDPQGLKNIYQTSPAQGQTSLPGGRTISGGYTSKMVVSRTEFGAPQSTTSQSVNSQINRSNILFKTHDSFRPGKKEVRGSNNQDKVIVMKSRNLASPRVGSHTSFSRKSNPTERSKRTFTSGLKIFKKVRDANGNIVKKNLGESIDLYCENILNKIQRQSRQRIGGNLRNYASVQPEGGVLSTIPSERGITSGGKTAVTYQSSRVIPMSSSSGYYGFSGSKVQRGSSRGSGQESGYFRSNRVSPNIRPEFRKNGASSQVKHV